jgi:hypothetical protein
MKFIVRFHPSLLKAILRIILRATSSMTRSQIRDFVETSSIERIREVLDLLQKLKRHVPVSQLPQHEVAFLLDLRDHEDFFKSLADGKLQDR